MAELQALEQRLESVCLQDENYDINTHLKAKVSRCSLPDTFALHFA
jgi:hypothetical protein